MQKPLPLAQLPTPIHRLERMSDALGIDLWVKRDDLTGMGLSGNKVRKLERLLADAVAQGATAVVTCGGVQSNHCRATAVAARRLGLHPHLLLRGVGEGVPQANHLLDVLLGATIIGCTADEYTFHRDARMAAIAEGIAQRGGVPYVIPEGGSNALGSMAYARAVDELAAQADPFDHVVVAVGSGGTLAGLVAGGLPGRVVGMAVCDDSAYFRAIVEALVCELADEIGPRDCDWRVDDRYKGEAYGVASAEVWRDMAWAARTEGLLLGPTYTGKAMHGLLQEARAGRVGGRVLFWHTGGAFGLFGRGHELPSP